MTGRLHVHLQNLDPRDPDFHFEPGMIGAGWARNAAVSADCDWTLGTTDADLTAALPTADVLVTWTRVVKARFPTPAPRLKLLQLTSAGLDRILPFDWAPPDLIVLNNSGVHAVKAGEYGIAAILALNLAMPRCAIDQRHGLWRPSFGTAARGKTVVILGTGAIGGAIAANAARLGLGVIGVNRSGVAHQACARTIPIDRIDEVLPDADFLVVTVPLTAATRGAIDARRLDLLKPGACLINLARGAIIDQEALRQRLESGRLGGAVLDVTTPEPLPPDDPLWRAPNLLITPHMSADDPATYLPDTLDILFTNIAAWRRGDRPPNQVLSERGY
jgi:phosphoglycerate dehydrogenase-like enzyme